MLKRAFDHNMFFHRADCPLSAACGGGLSGKNRQQRPRLLPAGKDGKELQTFQDHKIQDHGSRFRRAGSLITVCGDSRVTRLGRFLRKYKIDELPQLINVLKGDMSLVGPRPEVKKYVGLFRTDYEKLLTVRPGITDPASLRYSDEEALLSLSANWEETTSSAYCRRR